MIRYLYLLIFLTSCGLRDSQTLSDNVFQGEWTLTRIGCYVSSSTDSEIETYEISNVSDISFSVVGSQFEYTSKGTCTTSSFGRYNTDFDGTGIGSVSFYNVVTGGTTCTETVQDSGTSGVPDQTITTTFTNANNLRWVYSELNSTLEIEFFANFKGSGEQSTCNSNCFCTALFTN